jgi:peptidoglycan/xylan/chitin deacetylase (PgdA/CDA1 family)
LNLLKRKGYTPIPLSHLVDLLYGRPVDLPKRPVVITVDDGYRSLYTVGYPIIFKEYGFPFTAFIYTNVVGRTKEAVTWAEMEEMAAAGVDMQGHTKSHHPLTRRNLGEVEESYRARIGQELVESTQILEAHLKKPVTCLAYPYGIFDAAVEAMVKEAGYRAALTCNSGNNDRATGPYHIDRRIVGRRLSLERFETILEILPLDVADLAPAEGEVVYATPEVVSARILNLDRIVAKSVRFHISTQVGIVPVLDPATGYAFCRVPKPLSQRVHEVAVTGRDRLTGEPRQASWIFIIRPPKEAERGPRTEGGAEGE